MIVRRRGAGAVDERRLSRWAGGVDCQVRRGKSFAGGRGGRVGIRVGRGARSLPVGARGAVGVRWRKGIGGC
jgi:hypothetical protein